MMGCMTDGVSARPHESMYIYGMTFVCISKMFLLPLGNVRVLNAIKILYGRLFLNLWTSAPL